MDIFTEKEYGKWTEVKNVSPTVAADDWHATLASPVIQREDEQTARLVMNPDRRLAIRAAESHLGADHHSLLKLPFAAS